MVKSFGAQILETTILVDNRSVLLATQSKNELKKKHLAIAYNYVREAAAHGHVRYAYIPTEINLADILTKSLGKNAFWNILNQIPQV